MSASLKFMRLNAIWMERASSTIRRTVRGSFRVMWPNFGEFKWLLINNGLHSVSSRPSLDKSQIETLKLRVSIKVISRRSAADKWPTAAAKRIKRMPLWATDCTHCSAFDQSQQKGRGWRRNEEVFWFEMSTFLFWFQKNTFLIS